MQVNIPQLDRQITEELSGIYGLMMRFLEHSSLKLAEQIMRVKE